MSDNMKKLGETTIPANYHTMVLDQSQGHDTVGEEFVEPIYKFITQALADAAKQFREKDKPAAIVIIDMKGNILFGVKIEFIPGENEESGSWNTIWSFNPEDFEDCKKYQSESAMVAPIFVNRAVSHHLHLYSDYTTAYILERTAIEVLRQWLDANASTEGTVSVGIENFFEATVDVVDGIKIFNFIPTEEITNIAKSDADIISA